MADENTAVTGIAVTDGAVTTTTETTQAVVADTVTTDSGQATTEAPVIAAPEAPVTVLESTTDEGGAIEYEPTGDPALDVALNYMGSLGFAGDSDAMQRAAKGDFTLLEAQLAVLGDKARGYERMIALAKDAYSKSAAKAQETVKASSDAVISVVGSRENWSTIVTWAAANATPEEKAEINKMIDGGPVQARAAASLLQSAYQKASGTKVNPAPVVKDAAGAAVVTTGPLNAKDYGTAVRELHAKLGNRMETSQEYADLQRRLR